MIFRQLFDATTSSFTYLLADSETREAVLIDSVLEQVERDTTLIEELGLKLVYTLETHVHADHVTGSGALRSRLGSQSITSAKASVDCADIHVHEGDEITFGRHRLYVLETPGHTAGCVSYVLQDGDDTMVFTGDALLIRSCGRTDFQQGNAHHLFHSVRTKLFGLPDTTRVYPAHDYRGHQVSTIGEEQAFNTRLNKAIDESTFIATMAILKLPHPRLMDVAVSANLSCGLPQTLPPPAGD